MGYKGLRDIAREKNITIRALQHHIKAHESELEGHMIRYGPPRGTFLDEAGEEFITNLLTGHSVAVADQNLINEIGRLKNELESVQKRVIELLEERSSLSERALTAESKIALAEASLTATEEKVQLLETSLQDARIRAEEAEEKVMALKRRSLWQRIRRLGED